MLIVGARSMLIVGAAPFINGHTNYQHENVDSWCSTVYKQGMLIVGAQHIDCLDMPFNVHITHKVTMITVSGFLTM